MGYESSNITLEDEIEDEVAETEVILTEVLENPEQESKSPILAEKPGVREVEVRRSIEEYLERKRNKRYEDVFTFDDEGE